MYLTTLGILLLGIIILFFVQADIKAKLDVGGWTLIIGIKITGALMVIGSIALFLIDFAQ